MRLGFPASFFINIMQKTVINVPKGIRFINQWTEFQLQDFPCILDKKIPGCGFTEYCITNNQNIILASPRKILLENKEAQHKGEVLLIKNQLDQVIRVDKSLEKKDTMLINIDVSDQERDNIILAIKQQVIDYANDRYSKNLPCKILVTYDSYKLIKEALISCNIFDSFYTVIDEFQSIFTDSRFKANTELEFVNNLLDVSRVCFVSATPMIDSYLDEIDEFKDLPYYELDWEAEEPERIEKPNIKARSTQSILPVISSIVETYKSGNFERAIIPDDSPEGYHYIESREAVFYVNSVSNIVSVLKKCNLDPSEVNILCANTPENKKKLGRRYKIGSVPLLGEPHKMFTFCTRTVYLGADFYSDNARSFILSDANIETLAVDITLDLPQILGRQRLSNNPWKNKAELYYKTLSNKNIVLKDEFDKILERKTDNTKELEKAWNNLPAGKSKNLVAEKFIDSIRLVNYKRDYASINNMSSGNPEFALNKLVYIAERRAFDIQQLDYKDRFSVFNSLYNNGNNLSGSKLCIEKINKFLDSFNKIDIFYNKLKYLCEESINFDNRELEMIFDLIPKSFGKYYKILGADGCKQYGYNYSRLNNAIKVLEYNKDDLKTSVHLYFKEDSVISKSDMKACLQVVYNSLNLPRVAKASDIEEWFETTLVNVTDPNTGKRSKCYKLLKKI